MDKMTKIYVKQEGQDGRGSLTRVFEITLAIFFCPFNPLPDDKFWTLPN